MSDALLAKRPLNLVSNFSINPYESAEEVRGSFLTADPAPSAPKADSETGCKRDLDNMPSRVLIYDTTSYRLPWSTKRVIKKDVCNCRSAHTRSVSISLFSSIPRRHFDRISVAYMAQLCFFTALCQWLIGFS